MGYAAIGTQLKSILDGVSGFEAVYGYEPNELTSYPAATISALSHENSFLDTAANDRRYTFMIRLFYRTDQDADAESILRGLADDVITALEQNVSVAGVWEIARPTRSNWTFAQREIPLRVCEITVEIQSRVVRG